MHADTDNKILDSLSGFIVSLAEPAILPLVKRFFQNNGMRAQAAKNDRVYILRDSNQNNAIVAALRLCPLGDSWLLRSMVVDKNQQRRGLGSHLLLSIRSELDKIDCYCFAYSWLQSFYQNAGFEMIAEKETSDEILQRFLQYAAKDKTLILMHYQPTVDTTV